MDYAYAADVIDSLLEAWIYLLLLHCTGISNCLLQLEQEKYRLCTPVRNTRLSLFPILNCGTRMTRKRAI